MSQTPEQTQHGNEYARAKRNAYLRQYRADHAKTTLQWRINAAVSLLQRNGWRLVPPAVCEGGDTCDN